MQNQIVLFVVAGILIASGGAAAGWYAGISRINDVEIRLADRLERTESILIELADDADALRSELVAQQIIVAEEAANLRTAFDESVSELTTTVGTQGVALETLSDAADVSGLIDKWSRYVYDITCDFEEENGDPKKGSGSATLMYENGQIVFVTNAHVVEEDDATLVRCELVMPDSEADEIIVLAKDIDINDDTDVARGRISGIHPAMTSSEICPTNPRIGERIVTLGYPQIGGEESITATEGIISGFDDGYYTTSAKIERGNSGGAAVSVERNCFLGLPTLVFAGRIESLARILPASSL